MRRFFCVPVISFALISWPSSANFLTKLLIKYFGQELRAKDVNIRSLPGTQQKGLYRAWGTIGSIIHWVVWSSASLCDRVQNSIFFCCSLFLCFLVTSFIREHLHRVATATTSVYFLFSLGSPVFRIPEKQSWYGSQEVIINSRGEYDNNLIISKSWT